MSNANMQKPRLYSSWAKKSTIPWFLAAQFGAEKETDLQAPEALDQKKPSGLTVSPINARIPGLDVPKAACQAVPTRRSPDLGLASEHSLARMLGTNSK